MRSCRVAVLIAAVAAAACAREPGRGGPAGAALDWTMRDLQRSWSADSADTVRDVWVSLHYPEFTAAPGGRAAVDSLNRWVESRLVAAAATDSTPADLEALAARMIANYQELRRDIGGPAAAWFYENEVRVTWDSLGLVSLVSTADSYTGGAHGSAVRLHGVLDTRTGRRLALDDLFEPVARESLRALGEAAFRAARRLPPGAPLDREGFWFPSGRFALTPNFGIEPGGVVFHYNSYEIAPYAMGPTTLRLPWEPLAGLLRGPLEPLASR